MTIKIQSLNYPLLTLTTIFLILNRKYISAKKTQITHVDLSFFYMSFIFETFSKIENTYSIYFPTFLIDLIFPAVIIYFTHTKNLTLQSKSELGIFVILLSITSTYYTSLGLYVLAIICLLHLFKRNILLKKPNPIKVVNYPLYAIGLFLMQLLTIFTKNVDYSVNHSTLKIISQFYTTFFLINTIVFYVKFRKA